MTNQQNAQERNVQPQHLTVSVTYERRVKELANVISQCEMMIEMAKNEMNILQVNARQALQQAKEQQEGQVAVPPAPAAESVTETVEKSDKEKK